MAVPNANKTFWGFVFYVTHNRHKIDLIPVQDLLKMAESYAVANQDAITNYEIGTGANSTDSISTTAFKANSGAFTDVEWPNKTGTTGGTAAVGILSTGAESPSIQSAWYPEQHG